MVPCGGLYKSQSKVSVTPVRSGESLTVSWEMGFWTGAALHQGTVVLSIAPATANDVGPWTQLAEISFVGCASVSCSPKSAVVQIPSGYKDGDMLTMSFNWTASVTPEIFYNCADLVVASGSYTPSDAPDKITSQVNMPSTLIAALAPSHAPSPTSPAITFTEPNTPSACVKPGKLTCDSSRGTLSICDGSTGSWLNLGTIGGSCTLGDSICVGEHYAVCEPSGKWVCMDCAKGTVCSKAGKGPVICDYAAQSDLSSHDDSVVGGGAVRRHKRSDEEL